MKSDGIEKEGGENEESVLRVSMKWRRRVGEESQKENMINEKEYLPEKEC